MAERFTIDSNILVYSLDLRDPQKQQLAEQVIVLAAAADCVLTSIALAECFYASNRKLGLAGPLLAQKLELLAQQFRTTNYTTASVIEAMTQFSAGRFGFFDAILLSCANDAGCTICFSEDMQDGARLGQIVVRNPFGPKGLSAVARRVLNAP